MDENDKLFGMLRRGPFGLPSGFDPGQTAYDAQPPSIAPEGFVDEFDSQFIISLILYGLYNGDFGAVPPLGLGTPIAAITNELAGWWGGVTHVNGSAFTASVVADTGSPSAQNLRWVMASGTASNESRIEQTFPISGDRGLTSGYGPRLAGTCVAISGGTVRVSLEQQYMKADRVTTTGSAGTITKDITGTGDFTAYSTDNAPAPADAYFVRVRLSVKRQVGTTNTATVDIADVRFDRTVTGVILADRSAPGTYNPGRVYQEDGAIYIIPTQARVANSSTEYIAIHSNKTISLELGSAVGGMQLSTDTGSGFTPGLSGALAGGSPFALTIGEGSGAPSTPASGYYSIYALDDGILYGKNDAGTEVALGGGTSTVIRPSISANQNNWAPTGLANNCVIIVNLNGANRTITGLSALADGAHVELMAQSSTDTISLSHLSASSSAANQFRCPAGVAYVVGNKAGVRLVYDATDQKWRVVGPA